MTSDIARIRRLSLVAFCALTTTHAFAHHILGIPHYAYDEDYPQAPVLTYSVDAGRYEIKMTGYPGRPEPGVPSTLHVYVRELESGLPFDGSVVMTVMKDRLLGQDSIVYGPVAAELEESLFKFYPLFKDEANYTVRIAYEADGAPWKIDLPMVAGEPGSPWATVGGVFGALGAFLVVIRAIRIKRKRLADKDAKRQISQQAQQAANASE